ncbi:MAG: RAD52 family DNA repair protein [Chloroflexota bacterium]|jgi:recombination DNA repair RAD52 pathway protein|nr:RAD52 family DNA repair protein [Chloroflexota bacterium]
MVTMLADARPPAEQRTAEEILELLGRRFRPEVVQQRKIGGRQVAYVPVAAVIERLNRACNTWNFRIVSRQTDVMLLNRWNAETRKSEPREVPVSVVIGELEIPELGARQAMGVQALDDGSGEDLLKGAGSDALKKAASMFGVSIEG